MKTSVLAITIFFLLAGLNSHAQDSTYITPAEKFYQMTKEAPVAFNAGEYDKAIEISQALLVEAENWKKDWNYGNALHAANLVLGRIALRKGEIDEAKKFLLDAGKTPGSPQLNSFGPDMLFAKEMLKRGQKEVVLEYFELCGVFWDKKAKLELWRTMVENDTVPDFGPNVAYIFGSAR